MSKIWTEEDVINVLKSEGYTETQIDLLMEETTIGGYVDEEEDADEDFYADITSIAYDWYKTEEIIEMNKGR